LQAARQHFAFGIFPFQKRRCNEPEKRGFQAHWARTSALAPAAATKAIRSIAFLGGCPLARWSIVQRKISVFNCLSDIETNEL
jgi:hypothetical protein